MVMEAKFKWNGEGCDGALRESKGKGQNGHLVRYFCWHQQFLVGQLKIGLNCYKKL